MKVEKEKGGYKLLNTAEVAINEGIKFKATDKLCSVVLNGRQYFVGTKEECEKFIKDHESEQAAKGRFKLLNTAEIYVNESLKTKEAAKDKLIESIKNLNKKKPLKEQADIQRVLPPADADAQEQHRQALEQNAKRKDPKNYDEAVKELIKETASEDSRYRHFDVVDRRDLAKKINEAKQKGLDFKVSKSTKEGFRYDLKVLKEEYLKKEAGDPEVSVQAFNNATNVGASSPSTGLGEGVMEAPFEKCSICDSVRFLIEDEEEAIDGYKKADECLKSLDNEELRVEISTLYNHIIGEELEHIKELQDALQKLDPKCAENQGIELHEDLTDEVYEEGEENSDYTDIGDDEEYLGEELKIFTSDLDNFHPSEQCKDLWEDIKDNGKIEDLEYALETLYPDGISDVALDDLLCYEEDWIRDLIDLPLDDEKTEDSIETEYEDEEDSDDNISEKDKDIIIDVVKGEFETGHGYIEDKDEFEEVLGRTLTIDEYEDLKEFYSELQDLGPVGFYEEYKDKLEFDTDFVREYGYNEDDESEDDIEPIEYSEDEESEVEDEPEKDTSEESESKESDEDIEEDDDDKVSDIAEGFIKNNFKPNTLNEDTTVEETMKKAVCESSDDEDDVVDISDDLVENMMGLPKKGE